MGLSQWGDPPQTGGATHPEPEGGPSPTRRGDPPRTSDSLSLFSFVSVRERQLCLCQREIERESLRFGVGRPFVLGWVAPPVWGGSPLRVWVGRPSS